MTEYGKHAGELFAKGYNCAQSVAGAFAEKADMELEEITKLASGFGGGIAGMREMCGAVSGMIIAAGMLKGYQQPCTPEVKRAHYSFCRELIDEFEEECGSIICHIQLEKQKNGEKGKLSCRELCCIAADILAKRI